jgi:hypothetical protein
MNAILCRVVLMGLVAAAPYGCEPRPISEDANQQEEVEIDVGRNGAIDDDPDAGVDVQIGGGEGVDVDVDTDRPGTDVDVGRDNQ